MTQCCDPNVPKRHARMQKPKSTQYCVAVTLLANTRRIKRDGKHFISPPAKYIATAHHGAILVRELQVVRTDWRQAVTSATRLAECGGITIVIMLRNVLARPGAATH